MNDQDGGGLALLDAGPKGRGVFAIRDFRRGERLLEFNGARLAASSIKDFTHVIQVDVDVFLGPSGELDDFVNHSCDPNARLHRGHGGLELVALRTICAGAEITFDYSTCLLFEPSGGTCYCGSTRCRGTIARFWELSPAVRNRYRRLRAVPEFLLRAEPARSLG